MRVTVREASALLNASEDAVYAWIESGDLPAYKINDIYRINRSELLEWATTRNLHVAPELFREAEDEESIPAISACLELGGVYHGLAGDSRDDVLRSVVGVLRLSDEGEHEMLLNLLLAREAHASTAVGDGIAIPHVRAPIVLTTDDPMLSLCFLEHPVDFGAFDAKPVFALFVLVCPTIRVHLQMLAKLAFLLRNSEFREVVLRRAPADEILGTARRVEGAA